MSIQNWCAFGPHWPSSGGKLTKKSTFWWFLTIIKKTKSEFSSNLLHTLTWSVIRNDLIWGHIGPILALYWPKNNWKWWFVTIMWKASNWILFKLDVCTCLVDFHKLFNFGLPWHNFSTLVAKKWWFPTFISKTNYWIHMKLVRWVFKIDLLLAT